MENKLHTVLGASGATGQAVVAELEARNLPFRKVVNHAKVTDKVTVKANLLNLSETKAAVQGSGYVYLCIGLPYKTDLWKETWPVIMQNCIDACLEADACLIFFDNVYMYGPSPLPVPFNEESPQHPETRKGPIRKQIADMLLKAVKERKLKALIARSADFYGPDAVNSILYVQFMSNMLANKAPMVLSKPGFNHTYAYSPDNGRALVLLALDPGSYGQVWHLPVGEAKPVTYFADLINNKLGTRFKISYLPSFLRKLLGIFIPVLSEAGEMLYQFNNPYIMDFTKFKTRYPQFKVTPYPEGIEAMLASFKKGGNAKK